MLDVTAGNRMLWPNKNPPNTIFLDKETQLKVPPDIFASWFRLPFRHDVIDCIMFDPPHAIGFSKTSIHSNPKAIKGSWWGYFSSRADMIRSLVKAQKEFAKISKRLLLKWNDSTVSLWNILPLFNCWHEINRWEKKSGSNVSRSQTFWVTFINSEFTSKREDENVLS